MTRMSSEEAGTRAFDTLSIHVGGLSRKMWRHHAGVNEGQLRRGIDWLRDLFEHDIFLRLRRGGEWVYTVAILDRDVREHVERQLRSQITRARRDHNLFHNIARQFPTPENEHQEEMARRRLYDLTYAYDKLVGQEQLPA